MKKFFYYLLLFLLAAGLVFASYKLGQKKEKPETGETGEKPVVIKGKKYFVSVSGSDSNDGLSESSAFLTIQHAVNLLEPGDGVILENGTYHEDIVTRLNGTEDRPIIIMGEKGAIVKGSGEKNKIIEIGHDYHVLKGFTVDGLEGDKSKEESYRDKLIYVQSNVPNDGVTGIRILDMELRNAGGECLRMKYFASRNEVGHSRITGCGAYDFLLGGDGKNGEGIYIGTAPEQTDDKNPTNEDDNSDGNWIHDNFIDTQGNECVDVKERSSGNIIEKNKCTGQKDKESAGLDSRGSGNIFRNNESYGNVGAGIRLGGDKKTDGIENTVSGNYLHGNEGGGIKIQRKPQKEICENRFSDNEKGNLVGEYGEDSKNEKTCD